MTEVVLREIPDPLGIRQARTLSATWYADQTFFELERERVFRNGWICAGVVDELPVSGGWSARTVGGVPSISMTIH